MSPITYDDLEHAYPILAGLIQYPSHDPFPLPNRAVEVLPDASHITLDVNFTIRQGSMQSIRTL